MTEHNIDLDERRRERPSETTITVKGHVLRARASVRPEALVDWDDFWLGDDTSSRRQLEVADLTIKRFLHPEFHETFDRLRADEDDPLTSDDLRMIVEGLVAASADRPTAASSVSGPTTGSDEAGSTDGGSSRAALLSVPTGRS